MSILDGLTPDDIRRLRQMILGDPTDFGSTFKDWVPNWVALYGLETPISQVAGFARFTPQVADTIITSETTASTSYADLATVGPSITGLSDGSYMVIYSHTSSNNTGGFTAFMSISVDGVAASDDDMALATQVGSTAIQVTFVTLTGGNHSIVAKYRVNGGTGTFGRRRLAAIKYANA